MIGSRHLIENWKTRHPELKEARFRLFATAGPDCKDPTAPKVEVFGYKPTADPSVDLAVGRLAILPNRQAAMHVPPPKYLDQYVPRTRGGVLHNIFVTGYGEGFVGEARNEDGFLLSGIQRTAPTTLTLPKSSSEIKVRVGDLTSPPSAGCSGDCGGPYWALDPTGRKTVLAIHSGRQQSGPDGPVNYRYATRVDLPVVRDALRTAGCLQTPPLDAVPQMSCESQTFERQELVPPAMRQILKPVPLRVR